MARRRLGEGRWRYRYSGFSATIPASALGPGRHALTLKVFKAGGREYFQSQREFAVEVEGNVFQK